jgi:hypothetical protein
LSLRGRKYHENGENCIMMSFMIIIRALNLKGGVELGVEFGKYGGKRKRIQYFCGET